MSDLVKTCWRIIHDPAGTPTVLLDFGDRTSEEFGASWEKQGDVVPFVRSQYVGVFDRGGVSNSISIQRATTHADGAAAREWGITHAALVQMLGVADVSIQLKGSFTAMLRGALIQSGSVAAGKAVGARPELVLTTYEIVGGKLEVTA